MALYDDLLAGRQRNRSIYQTFDPYADIMSRMPAFQNPYANLANPYMGTGGYDPEIYKPRVMTAPAGLLGNSASIGYGGGGGNDQEAAPGSWSTLSDNEKAAYYADNPTMAAITQGLQNAFGFTTLGMLQNAMVPGFVQDQALIAQGINPNSTFNAPETLAPAGMITPNTTGNTAVIDAQQAMANALANARDENALGGLLGSYDSGGLDGGYGFSPGDGTSGLGY